MTKTINQVNVIFFYPGLSLHSNSKQLLLLKSHQRWIGPCKRTPYVSYEPCTIREKYGIVWNECNIYPKIFILFVLNKEYSYAQYMSLKYSKYIANILHINPVNLVDIETYLIG